MPAYWTAKLTEQEVQEIRERYVPYVCTAQKLANDYGVTVWTINKIVQGCSWQYLLTTNGE
jgi:hypothetical protein